MLHWRRLRRLPRCFRWRLHRRNRRANPTRSTSLTGPARPGFDITRFANVANGTFVTFYVTNTEALRDVLKAGRVAEDTRLLVTDTASGRLALLMDQMAFHHSAQGRAGNKDWLATF